LGTLTFGLHPPFLGGKAGSRGVAWLGYLGGLDQEPGQALPGIVPVTLTGAVTVGLDGDEAVSAKASPSQAYQARSAIAPPWQVY